jgi:hypothetical protein
MSDRALARKTAKEAIRLRKKLGNLKELQTLIEHYDDKLAKFEQSRTAPRTKSAEIAKKAAGTARRPTSASSKGKHAVSRPRLRLPSKAPDIPVVQFNSTRAA